jgi:hypothetical protein
MRTSASSVSSSSSSFSSSSLSTLCFNCYDPTHLIGQCPCKLTNMPRGCCYGCLFPLSGCSTHRASQISPPRGGIGKKCLAKDIATSLVWYHFRKGVQDPLHFNEQSMIRLRTARADCFASDPKAFALWLQQELSNCSGITNIIALFHDLIKPHLHAH